MLSKTTHCMRRSTSRLCLVAVTSMLGSTLALADSMSGSLNGEAHTWHVLKQGGASTANFTELSPGMLTVTLQGHVEERFSTQGTLSITFTMMNGQLVSPPEATYFHVSRFMPNYANQDAPAHWELSVSEVDGDSAHFVGRYQGTLALQGSPAADEPDTLELAVDFDVRALRDEM